MIFTLNNIHIIRLSLVFWLIRWMLMIYVDLFPAFIYLTHLSTNFVRHSNSRPWALECYRCGSNSDSVTYQLCDFGKVSLHICFLRLLICNMDYNKFTMGILLSPWFLSCYHTDLQTIVYLKIIDVLFLTLGTLLSHNFVWLFMLKMTN